VELGRVDGEGAGGPGRNLARGKLRLVGKRSRRKREARKAVAARAVAAARKEAADLAAGEPERDVDADRVGDVREVEFLYAGNRENQERRQDQPAQIAGTLAPFGEQPSRRLLAPDQERDEVEE